MKRLKTYLLPYKAGSKSGKLLSKALRILRINREGSNWINSPRKRVINWGCTEENLPPNLRDPSIVWVNSPQAVSVAADKLLSFNAMKDMGVNVVPFTTDKEVAFEWGRESTVILRHKLKANSGEGIEIVEPEGYIADAPLYTKYIPKKYEYRIHVFQGNIIARQRKARKEEIEDDAINWRIRNLAGGFIFARNEGRPVPVDVDHQAYLAVQAMGLDFGAVDIGYDEKNDRAWVYEVNTACGLEGSTLDDYFYAIKNM